MLHYDERLVFVEMHEARYNARIAGLLPDESMVLEKGAVQGQRPTFADQTHLGKGLLHDHRTNRAFDDKDQVEVAVADFLHAPSSRCAAYGTGDGVETSQSDRQRFGSQRFVTGHVKPLKVPAPSQHN